MTTTDPQHDTSSLSAISDDDSSDSQSDVVILNQIARGDMTHFDTFVDRYRNHLIHFFYKRVFDYHIAEDLSQEVFMRAFRAARLKPLHAHNGCLSSWLFTIAHHCLIDLFRRGLRTIKMQDGMSADDVHHGLWSKASAEDPADIVDHVEQRQAADQLLSTLPESQQRVVRLKIFDNKTFSEIAETLDCSVPTAKSRMRYGLSKIYQLMTRKKDKEK